MEGLQHSTAAWPVGQGSPTGERAQALALKRPPSPASGWPGLTSSTTAGQWVARAHVVNHARQPEPPAGGEGSASARRLGWSGLGAWQADPSLPLRFATGQALGLTDRPAGAYAGLGLTDRPPGACGCAWSDGSFGGRMRWAWVDGSTNRGMRGAWSDRSNGRTVSWRSGGRIQGRGSASGVNSQQPSPGPGRSGVDEDLGGRRGRSGALWQREAEQAAGAFLALAPDLAVV